MSGKKTLFIIFLALAVAGFSLIFLSSTRRDREGGQILSVKNWMSGSPPEVGHPVSDFELSDLEGRMIRLSDLRGKAVFLNIWATWCPPCVYEMPLIERLHRTMRDRSFMVLTVSQDSGDGEKVRRFARKLELTFHILLDPEQKLSRLFRVTGYPESYIIDKEGILVQKIIGAREWSSPEWVGAMTQLAER